MLCMNLSVFDAFSLALLAVMIRKDKYSLNTCLLLTLNLLQGEGSQSGATKNKCIIADCGQL